MGNLSADLRKQYDDLKEVYEDARINERASQMEKLAKLISGLAKQIKEHEIHEKETLTRAELLRYGGRIGKKIASIVNRYIRDEDLAALLTDEFADSIDEILHDPEP